MISPIVRWAVVAARGKKCSSGPVFLEAVGLTWCYALVVVHADIGLEPFSLCNRMMFYCIQVRSSLLVLPQY